MMVSHCSMRGNDFRDVRVAIAHYWLVTWRGGEKVVRALLDIFPQADIYTLFYDPVVCGPNVQGHRVHSSAYDHPFVRNRYQKFFPLYSSAVRSLKLKGDYDLIISSESGPIKGLPNPTSIPHLSYVHTPMRYCWGFREDYLRAVPLALRPIANLSFEALRRYDVTTISKVDEFVANSENVKERIGRFYGRNAEVVYPPIALDLFGDSNLVLTSSSDREYFLSFGAITPYKGVGMLVDAFNRSGRRLIVVGEGSERLKLQSRAKNNVQFTGSLPYSRIRELILGAKALIFPGEEDFGMIPLEVMAHGVPVIALAKGGALETVVEEETGMFFAEQTVDSLEQVLARFDCVQNDFDPGRIRLHARGFGEDVFKSKMSAKVAQFLSSRLQR